MLSIIALAFFFRTIILSSHASAVEPSNITHKSAPSLDESYGKVVEECKTKTGRQIYLFKQWYLASGVITRNMLPDYSLPQQKNQTAIFRQLDAWIEKGKLKEIFAEGCSGELNSQSTIAFNGWTMPELIAAREQDMFLDIVTSIPMKLEARYADKLKTVCGEDEELVKETSLAFSDARGIAGFLSRLEQLKANPEAAKTYLEGSIQVLSLPKETTINQATMKLRERLTYILKRINDSIERRNEYLVKKVMATTEPVVAIIFGGLHSTGIVSRLNEAGLSCTVVEPIGYEADDRKLLQRLEAAIKGSD